jgi:hypothetical protein
MGGHINGGGGREHDAGLVSAGWAGGSQSRQAREAMTAKGDSISSRGNVAAIRDAANDMQEQCAIYACGEMNVTDAE